MRILGIDPGSRICGWGIVEEVRSPSTLAHVDCGIVAPKASLPLAARLAFIYEGLRNVIETHRPDEAAIETVFFAKNSKSALTLGQARGVALLAAHHAELPVHEYTPAQIKQAVCGYGRAEKEQVARMVMTILRLPEIAQADASDALACAICHSSSYRLQRAIRSR